LSEDFTAWIFLCVRHSKPECYERFAVNNRESVLDGIVLAPDAQISETPGSIVGEIISGRNINIASGAKIQGVASVPDSGSCMFLLSIGIGCLIQAKKRFLS
jgi:hypothetical protein